MTTLHAFILGMIQGLTEFFPISSSLHLKLTCQFLHIESDSSLFCFCHLATSFSVLLFFRKKIFFLLAQKPKEIIYYVLALLPLVFVYCILGNRIKNISEIFMGPFLLLTSVILFMFKENKIDAPTFSGKIKDVVCIGSAQALSLIPGLSRSALTLFTATKRGWSVQEAFCFSYLLSVPTVWGGCILESSFIQKIDLIPLTIAFITAFIVGFFALFLVKKVLEKKKYTLFGFYCLFLSFALIFHNLWRFLL